MVLKDFPMDCENSGCLLQMIPNLLMKGGEFVKGNGWANMMLGVVGHIPKEECY